MDNLIYYGGAVKALGNGKIGGYGIRFTSENEPDLDGEFFTKDTFFGQKSELPTFYQHGFDAVLGAEPLKSANLPIMAKNTTEDEIGLWYEAQLDLSNQYQAYLYQMAEQGLLGYSTGAVGHLVQKENKGNATWIKSWALGEISLTPTPAEPKNIVLPAKSVKLTIPENMSLSQYVNVITDAWYSQFPDAYDDISGDYTFYSYIRDVFESYVIVKIKENGKRALYRVAYLKNNEGVAFSTNRVEVEQVTTYEEINGMMKFLKSKGNAEESPNKGVSVIADEEDVISQALDKIKELFQL